MIHRAKPRLIVLTDISSLTPGVREPDDGQSMIRLMLYANEIDIEGLVASSNMTHGQVCRPELIRSVVDAYEQVQPALRQHSLDYPSAEQLAHCIVGGQPVAGPQTAVSDSIGPDKDTAASEWIIAAAARPDPRPLWIAAWGGTADLAQALWRMRETLTESELAARLSNLRIHAVGDQDTTGTWIKANFPGLFYITRTFGIRGIYRGGDPTLVSSEWVEANIHNRHGALGDLYPNYDGGDIWSRQIGPVKGIKEGDTPSYLGLINNGLNPNIIPEWGSWGGRCEPTPEQPNQYQDAIDDTHPETHKDMKPHMSATHRWRPAFQNDFAARLDWCVRSYADGNHPPIVEVDTHHPSRWKNGALVISAPAGSQVELNAEQSSDPDGDAITYHWLSYPEAGSYRGKISLSRDNRPGLIVPVPAVTQSETIHLILQVTDSGEPPLTAYQRVIIKAEP